MFNRLHHRKNANGNGGDLEASQNAGEPSNSTDSENLSEYVALDRYISTFREEGSREEEPKKKKIPWWKFWVIPEPTQKELEDREIVPDAWLDSDIHAGIPDTEIDQRRRRMGWNELTSEKENLVLKFLGYFTGPILYGEFDPTSTVRFTQLTHRSYGDCCHIGSRPQ